MSPAKYKKLIISPNGSDLPVDESGVTCGGHPTAFRRKKMVFTFFGQKRYFLAVKLTFLLFSTDFFKFWAQIRDQRKILARKCILVLFLARKMKKLRISGFRQFSDDFTKNGKFSNFFIFWARNKTNIHFPAKILRWSRICAQNLKKSVENKRKVNFTAKK